MLNPTLVVLRKCVYLNRIGSTHVFVFVSFSYAFHPDKQNFLNEINNSQQFYCSCFCIFVEIQRERRELVRKTVTTTTTRRLRSGPQGNPGPGRPSNETRPGVQEDAEPFNPDNPYHVSAGVCTTASPEHMKPSTEAAVVLLEISKQHLVSNFYSIISNTS